MNNIVSEELETLAREKGFYYEDPTQANMISWLGIEHKLYLNILHKPWNQEFGFSVTGSYNSGNNGVLIPYSFKSYESKEECINEALKQSLNLI